MDDYTAVENVQRDRRTGKAVAVSHWVCGPDGYLSGPFDAQAAQALARQLNHAGRAAEADPRAIGQLAGDAARKASAPASGDSALA